MKNFCSKLKKIFVRKQNGTDFSAYFDEPPKTRKQRLLEDCEKHDVSVHIDDAAEQSSSFSALFRGVASEAELERRLNEKKAIHNANRANVISAISLIVSIVALIISLK